MILIYKIINNLNNKVYIGMTSKSLEERFQKHLSVARCNPKFRIHQAIYKHGSENFIIIKIDSAETQNEADEKEKYWIKFYNSTNYKFGYNMSNGGQGKSIIISNQTKEKMSKSIKAHRDSLTEEQRNQMTKKANEKKKGFKESEKSRLLKSESQKKRWAKTSEEEKKLHGKRTKNGITKEGKERQIKALHESFSPVREKGYKQPIVKCPHCDKQGGQSLMKRWHFENCKYKLTNK